MQATARGLSVVSATSCARRRLIRDVLLKKMISTYRIELDGEFIGESSLETADPPMGVVGGKVTFAITEDPYFFFKRIFRGLAPGAASA